MVDLGVGSLALRAAKTAYDLWRENRSDAALDLTDDARAVLKLMQGDSTGNGIFMDVTGLGTSALRLACLYKTDIGIETTRRVITELDAKGLVEPHQSQNGRSHGVKLTHLGWILNPETGKADKVGLTRQKVKLRHYRPPCRR